MNISFKTSLIITLLFGLVDYAWASAASAEDHSAERTAMVVMGDLGSDIAMYLYDASKGDAKAQNKIGIMYQNHKRYDMACKWYFAAAKQGFAPAQYNLGNLHLHGITYLEDQGVILSHQWAEYWFNKAAAQGLEKAWDKLANLEDWPPKGKLIRRISIS